MRCQLIFLHDVIISRAISSISNFAYNIELNLLNLKSMEFNEDFYRKANNISAFNDILAKTFK